MRLACRRADQFGGAVGPEEMRDVELAFRRRRPIAAVSWAALLRVKTPAMAALTDGSARSRMIAARAAGSGTS